MVSLRSSPSSTTLDGPYTLTTADVDIRVIHTKPGVYVLSRNGKTGRYVGRSDDDVAKRIKQHLHEGYSHFWYQYAIDSVDAYRQECHWYHELGGLDNIVHPAKPGYNSLRCHICGN